MLKANSLFVCTQNECDLSHWFLLLNVIMNHPLLNDDEKSIWRWLATHCANGVDSSCIFSYQQLSQTLNMPCKQIHRALFRFRIMGLLKTDIPVWYGKLTPEMESEMRVLMPAISFRLFWEQRKGMGPLNTRKHMTFNLLDSKCKT